jgi:hypothetical protein
MDAAAAAAAAASQTGAGAYCVGMELILNSVC